MGEAIELVPGKSEEYLRLEILGQCRLWLRGDHAQPMAYIEAAIFGNESHTGYPAFTAAATKAFQDVLGIALENCYMAVGNVLDRHLRHGCRRGLSGL